MSAAAQVPKKTAEYELLVLNSIDLARDPANRWPIVVKKETKMAEPMNPSTATAPVGGTSPADGQGSMLAQILALLQDLATQSKAIPVQKEAACSVTFKRPAAGQSGPILVTKQVGAISTKALADLEALAAPALRTMEEVTIPFTPGVTVEAAPASQTSQDVITVQKDLATALAGIQSALTGDTGISARLAGLEAAFKVKKSGQLATDPEPAAAGAGDCDPDVFDDPEAFLPDNLKSK